MSNPTTDPKLSRERRLTWPVVSAILHEMGLYHDVGPLGFKLAPRHRHTRLALEQARLESSGGIACHSYHWHISTQNAEGLWCHTESVTTRKALRKLLREWAAGPKPPGARYAQMHSNSYGDAWIWVY